MPQADLAGARPVPHATDPDRAVFLRAAVAIGVRVAVVCAVLVLAGAALVFGYVWWKATTGGGREVGDHHILLSLDPVDLAVAAVVLGVAAIVLAGAAATWIARRAALPVAESLRRQRSFVADASHELRTPLAVLHARVQQLDVLVGEDPRLRPVVTELREDSRILVDIVDDLLQTAAGTGTDGSPASLADTMTRVGNDLGVLAAGRGVALDVETADALVGLPAVPLQRCLTALTDNAIGHTPPGGRVLLSATTTGRWAAVRVTDQGAGIRGIAPDRVFDRFAHGPGADPATGPTRSTHGIGLALVHDVVGRHGGTVTVEHTGADGTTFLLKLPRVAAVQPAATVVR
ncbi:HAMP domain-containing sensor histidine kinase [Tersicoccus sp. MR15.9]|uniref:sensor histidine kinase n=1 Tax=Tersicoccus mangrovi TaxID=3121635 RepID=UPI002FE5B4F5